jgi:hypothetical protein
MIGYVSAKLLGVFSIADLFAQSIKSPTPELQDISTGGTSDVGQIAMVDRRDVSLVVFVEESAWRVIGCPSRASLSARLNLWGWIGPINQPAVNCLWTEIQTKLTR